MFQNILVYLYLMNKHNFKIRLKYYNHILNYNEKNISI